MSAPKMPEPTPYNDHTPLPWYSSVLTPFENEEGGEISINAEDWTNHTIVNQNIEGPEEGTANAAFIVHACNTYYDNAARIQALEGLAKQMREALESIGKDAREVFDHGQSLITLKAGTGRIIATSDRAISAADELGITTENP